MHKLLSAVTMYFKLMTKKSGMDLISFRESLAKEDSVTCVICHPFASDMSLFGPAYTASTLGSLFMDLFISLNTTVIIPMTI